MTWSRIEGALRTMQGIFSERMGRLFGFGHFESSGKREQMIGLLQKHYGLSADSAREEFEKLKEECHCA